MLELILLLSSIAVLIILVFFAFLFHGRCTKQEETDIENTGNRERSEKQEEQKPETQELQTFEGGEDLTINDILEAPGEVIGKSSYGTLYEASLQRTQTMRALRFLRPGATFEVEDFGEMVRFLGGIRHPNLVPLLGFYSGQRGEKLLVHPFYGRGNLADFIREGKAESHRWEVIHKISLGIAKGLDHLHTALEKPLIHGNLKSKNILLHTNYAPIVSDFGLHLLLNPTAALQLLQDSAGSGYKAPELIKMSDASEQTDIYSYGVILLELLSGKEPFTGLPTANEAVHLPNFVRTAFLGRRTAGLFHPDFLVGGGITEEEILKSFQLAMACCSSSPTIRPSFKQVIAKLEEIGK